MKRIVYTIAVGKPKFAESALGLGRSLKLIGDTTRRVVITDQLDFPWDRCFDEVLPPKEPLEWTLMSKLSALERTDADQVAFIDGDCLAFKRLDPIFDYCRGKGLCVQGYPIQEGEWYGDVAGHLKRLGLCAMPKFNGGLIVYERTPECMAVIDSCYQMGRKGKELGFSYGHSLLPEEPYVAAAMARIGIESPGASHLIPETTDFTSSATGLVGKLEMDVMRNRCQFVCRRSDLRSVQPYIFHASRYINFTIYWKQLDKLRALEEYEQQHGFGYMSPWHKLERSVQRRYLKYIKRVL